MDGEDASRCSSIVASRCAMRMLSCVVIRLHHMAWLVTDGAVSPSGMAPLPLRPPSVWRSALVFVRMRSFTADHPPAHAQTLCSGCAYC